MQGTAPIINTAAIIKYLMPAFGDALRTDPGSVPMLPAILRVRQETASVDFMAIRSGFRSGSCKKDSVVESEKREIKASRTMRLLAIVFGGLRFALVWHE